MPLDRILLEDFRNHAATALDGTAHFNLLVGENGAGKTNVLEALSLLAPGRGLRRAALCEMARTGAGGFAASAMLDGGVTLGTAVRAALPNRRVVHANGAEVPAVRLGEWLSLAWLTPAMDRLFADAAGARRRFLDRLVLAREPGHAALAATPEQPFARPALAYASETPADFPAALRNGRRRDRSTGRTLVGPHRDDLSVTLAAKARPAAECSTGEQKAMLIAILLAHAGLAERGVPRVLLLDEVAAHLDPLRRAALFDRLRATSGQVWLTGTEPAPFAEILAEAAVWEVRDGAVARIS